MTIKANASEGTCRFPVLAGTVDVDGRSLRVFLAREIVRIALARDLRFKEVAEANGMTETALRELMEGAENGADLWTLFVILVTHVLPRFALRCKARWRARDRFIPGH
jgi:hypothetical protein